MLRFLEVRPDVPLSEPEISTSIKYSVNTSSCLRGSPNRTLHTKFIFNVRVMAKRLLNLVELSSVKSAPCYGMKISYVLVEHLIDNTGANRSTSSKLDQKYPA